MWRQGFCTVYDHANMPHKSLWEVSPYYASKTACGARGKPCQIIWRTPAFYLSNHSDPVWSVCGDRADPALPADQRSAGRGQGGREGVGAATRGARQVQAGREKGGDQNLAGVAGLQGIHRQNHRRGPRDTLPFYTFTRTYAKVIQQELWTGGALFFVPLLREPL